MVVPQHFTEATAVLESPFPRPQEGSESVGCGGFLQIRGTLSWGPVNKDYCISGSILGSLYFGKLSCIGLPFHTATHAVQKGAFSSVACAVWGCNCAHTAYQSLQPSESSHHALAQHRNASYHNENDNDTHGLLSLLLSGAPSPRPCSLNLGPESWALSPQSVSPHRLSLKLKAP